MKLDTNVAKIPHQIFQFHEALYDLQMKSVVLKI